MKIWHRFKRVCTDTRYLQGSLSRVLTAINRKYHAKFVNHNGIDVMAADWDNLLILDGCRADLFRERSWLAGDYEERISQASQSKEFLKHNFAGRTLHDTVYVSANPYAARLPEDTFHTFVDLFRTGWDSDLQTVTPETVAAATRFIHKEYPNKRIVAHFMQPHYPFIGELGREIDRSSIGGELEGEDTADRIWAQLMYGENGLSEDQVWSAYAENLNLVLETVEDLLEDVDGRAVVTSDHGNMIGDRGYPIPVPGYGHPPEYYVDPLVRIPWLTVPGERRRIESTPPDRSARREMEGTDVTDRLRSLGYVE